ncbi:hypothetical protein [Delftia acidovorans]|uniref:hypothetical protein n=1 Tax=Delftia acidovorans TaxID=80866 RepID=UPI0028AA2DC0|nr:hypothetical protein [Delftia acidovorans]
MSNSSKASNESTTAPLRHWLAQGQAWLADMQAAGLAGAGMPLLAAGRAWADEGALLGWGALARQMDGVLDPQLTPAERAAALLDIAVWVMTAQRLQAGADQSLP